MASYVVQKIRNRIVPVRRTGWVDASLISLGYEAEESYLRDVIKQVVVGRGTEDGDKVRFSTSIMVYGPPGCGKSQLVDKVVESAQSEYGDSFEVVRLEGLYCFSLQDSVIEIFHQLMSDGEKDKADELVEGNGQTDPVSFDERLESVLFYLKTKLIEMKKSIVFIIDGIERFTDDSSQRLLYNLFDISANSTFSVPICIIGITTCMDILDSFEKRVRSRFSHRQINLVTKVEFAQYQEWARNLLTLKDKDWNAVVEKLLQEKEVIRILRRVYEADKSIGQLKRLLYAATLMCEEILSVSNIQDAYQQLFGIQCHIQMALDLPVSELVVLLGIFKKIQRSQQAWQPCEIYEIIRKPYSSYQLRKDDFIKTIIKLQDLELIVPVGGTQGRSISNLMESYFKCEISFTEFQEIWKKYPNLPSSFSEFL